MQTMQTTTTTTETPATAPAPVRPSLAALPDGWHPLPSYHGHALALRVEGHLPVRLSATCPEPATCEVTGCPCADGALRAHLERALDCWLDLPLATGEWSTAEGAGAAVRRCELSGDQPTHRIEYRAGHNPPDTAPPTRVALVRLCDDGGPDGSEPEGDGPAYDHDEWDATAHAAWSVTDGEWRCQGQCTPGGANG